MPEEENLTAPNRYAILIGINDYLPKPLKFSVNDVCLVREGLINYCRFMPEQIYVIESSTDHPHQDIHGEFLSLVSKLRSTLPTDAVFFFYFSGHGSHTDKSYLWFHDTKISLQEVYDLIDGLKPKSQCYVIDACHSGGNLEIKGGDGDMSEYFTDWFQARSEGVHFFCSSGADQSSWGMPELQHGVYTFNFVKAMSLYSLYDKELRTLSLNELHTYAVKRVYIDHNEYQTPFQYSKVSGYFPFCFYDVPRILTSKTINFPDTSEQSIYDFINDPALNLPEDIKRDLINFLTELFLNIFKYNRSTRIDIKIEGNVLELHDYSKISFDPFTAQTTVDGNGIHVYQIFMETYKGLITPSYEPGFPNVIKLTFDPEILDYNPIDPCHIEVGEVHLLNERSLNGYVFDPDCPEIVMDISKSVTHLSFIVRHLFDYLLKNTQESQMIVLKMHHKDMQRNFVRSYAGLEDRFRRIMVI
jgi:hypothetical protein